MASIEKNDLLEEFLCGICCKLFGTEVIPEILLCGHTYCKDCILQLDITTKLCPTCRTPMNGEHSSIKNFIHLSLVSQLKDRYFTESYTTELENFKSHILNNIGQLTKSRDLHNKSIKALDDLLVKVNNLLTDPESSSEEITEFISNIKTTMLSIHNETKEIKYIPKIFAIPSNDPCNYLLKIYRRIQSGEKLLTVHLPNYGSGFKYGRISVWSNILYFHCLTLNDSEDCLEFIRFDDLKSVVASNKINTTYTFRTFLKLRTETNVDHHIAITAMNSIFTPQFIRFCTGESGYSYIDTEYEYHRKDSCIVLKGFNDVSVDNFSNSDYCPDTLETLSLPGLNQYVVATNRNGGFKIFYAGENMLRKDCVGRIEHPEDILANVYKSGKVADCGVSFKVF